MGSCGLIETEPKESNTSVSKTKPNNQVLLRNLKATLVAKPTSFILASIVVALGVICLPYCHKNVPPKVKYGVIFDAGSTGTRVHVCSFTVLTTGDLVLQDDFHHEVRQSLGVCWKNSSRMINVGYILSPLLNFARKIVPETERLETPLFLKATAGLRLIDEETVDAILDATRGILFSSEFFFEPSMATVIDGTEEGFYGWVTVNTLLKRFSCDFKSVGILDLGGGSLQVAFNSNYENADNELVRQFSVGNHQYKVYSASFLGLGLVEFRKKFYEYLRVTNKSLNNPCFYRGVTSTIDVDGRQDDFVETGGTGDFDACLLLVEDILDKNDSLDILLKGRNRNEFVDLIDSSEFIAFAYFFDRTVGLGLKSDTTLSEISTFGRHICSEKLYTIMNKYSNVRNGASEHLCFDIAYVYVLLSQLFGSAEFNSKVLFLQNVAGAEFGWSVGALFHEMNRLALESKVL